MKACTHVRNQIALGFIKVGIITGSVLGMSGESSYAQPQPLGCNNMPLCTSPILNQLPANFDQRPRLDKAGRTVDAHDGMIVQFGDRFYLYGTSYGLTD